MKKQNIPKELIIKLRNIKIMLNAWYKIELNNSLTLQINKKKESNEFEIKNTVNFQVLFIRNKET